MHKNTKLLVGFTAACFTGAALYWVANNELTNLQLPVQIPATASSSIDALPNSQQAERSPTDSSQSSSNKKTALYDSRLLDFQVKEDNAMISYIKGSEGKIIAEIDNDPSSPSYHKMLKSYIYRQDKVVSVTKYQYTQDQSIETTLNADFNDDSSIRNYSESTTIKHLNN